MCHYSVDIENLYIIANEQEAVKGILRYAVRKLFIRYLSHCVLCATFYTKSRLAAASA